MKLINNSRITWLKSDYINVYHLKGESLTIAFKQSTKTVYLKDFFQYNFPKLYKFRRTYLPSFVQVNLYDCDSGGRCFASYPVFVLNDSHLVGICDAETSFNYISFTQWFKWKVNILRNGRN